MPDKLSCSLDSMTLCNGSACSACVFCLGLLAVKTWKVSEVAESQGLPGLLLKWRNGRKNCGFNSSINMSKELCYSGPVATHPC